MYIFTKLPVEAPIIEFDGSRPDDKGLFGVGDDAQCIFYLSVRRDEFQHRRAACIVGDANVEFVIDEDVLAVNAIDLYTDEFVAIDYGYTEHLSGLEFHVVTRHFGDEAEDWRIDIKIAELDGFSIAHCNAESACNCGHGNNNDQFCLRL